MEDSVFSFLKAEWKVSDTGSAHWASSLNKYSYKKVYQDMTSNRVHGMGFEHYATYITSPRNENLNLLVRIKFLNLFLYSFK